MTIYIKLKKNELNDVRTNSLNVRSSIIKLEKSKTKFKFLEKEKEELKKENSENFRYILDLIQKIEVNMPESESPYIKRELTQNGISVRPIIQNKTEKDYLKELKEINFKLQRKK